ncbi:hypothetical protein LEP1GSC036_2330 [Leptospira weilii str. 2006001853]|uniref:Uncharacterized protein n=4 Tax=Leptospira weilii TaxID=28184 RepID=A0A828YVY5_9LEPT|nr:hypothetical protein LEP1GSC036_2330 [Leptospira weilii str. 2006001853]EMJ66130.1 hypothetical protein LEP1GSC051_0401 [Leptospira sp. P2653]EMM70954.1 hypothetical protein LEP1GSC038_1571 [Leptospira weilii str. 2006001855]EMN92123.1 hypothetical protein LEP1GSC108_3036 [Leptospira weilii str. UI 13098]EMY11864.1 hypothetical protein LEP1GSC043_2954 [Leptospira weilii str. Ecochallenge]
MLRFTAVQFVFFHFRFQFVFFLQTRKKNNLLELSPLRPYLCFKKNDTITLKKQIRIRALQNSNPIQNKMRHRA